MCLEKSSKVVIYPKKKNSLHVVLLELRVLKLEKILIFQDLNAHIRPIYNKTLIAFCNI